MSLSLTSRTKETGMSDAMDFLNGDRTMRRMEEATRLHTSILYTNVMRQAPKDTGALRRIKMEINSTEGRVTVTAPYAAYVEFGTTKQPARPYFGFNAERQLSIYKSDLARIMKGKLI